MTMMLKDASRLSPYLQQCQVRITQQLSALFAAPAPSPRLQQAMAYSTLAGGKRLRALLIYASGGALQIPIEYLDAPAIAVELMHTYSLIHDDLPAMDNDDLRRGKPTCHKAFDEATAILAGDALQTLALTQLAQPHPYLSDTQQLQMIHCLTTACGLEGMAAGQMLDIESLGQSIDVAHLQQIHQLKTGALIAACVEIAIIAAQPAAETAIKMRQFAQKIGLAFQIQDDLLDVTSDASTLGKNTQRDASRDKPNYPALLGINACEDLLLQLKQEALTSLQQATPNHQYLQELAYWMIP